MAIKLASQPRRRIPLNVHLICDDLNITVLLIDIPGQEETEDPRIINLQADGSG